MDLLFVWWGAAWLGQWFFTYHSHSLFLTDAWLLCVWLILLWQLKKKDCLERYCLCIVDPFRLPGWKTALPVFLCLPVVNLALLIGSRPCLPDSASALQLAGLLVQTALVAVTEEFLFRSLLPLWFISTLHMRKNMAVIFSAGLFAAMHLLNGGTGTFLLCQILCAFAVGLYAGAITLQAKSLIPAMLLHILINITGEFVSSAVSPWQTFLYMIAAAVYLLCSIMILKHPNEEGSLL